MPPQIADYVDREDVECEELLECISGSKDLDSQIYFMLLEKSSMDIDQVAEEVERERSTVYRSVQRLKESGFVEQEKAGQEGGGYRHIYNPVEPEEVAEKMQRKLNDWYAEIGQLIEDFREKYSEK